MSAGLMLFKFGGLLIRQLAKPVANMLKEEAALRPRLKKVYVNVGQMVHRTTARITIAAAGHKNLGVKELEESAAFARGADFLSEALVLFVGSSILFIEITRSNIAAAQKETKKNAERKKFYENLELRFIALEDRLEALEKEHASSWARVFKKKGDDQVVTMAELPPLDPRLPPSTSQEGEGVKSDHLGRAAFNIASGERQKKSLIVSQAPGAGASSEGDNNVQASTSPRCRGSSGARNEKPVESAATLSRKTDPASSSSSTQVSKAPGPTSSSAASNASPESQMIIVAQPRRAGWFDWLWFLLGNRPPGETDSPHSASSHLSLEEEKARAPPITGAGAVAMKSSNKEAPSASSAGKGGQTLSSAATKSKQ